MAGYFNALDPRPLLAAVVVAILSAASATDAAASPLSPTEGRILAGVIDRGRDEGLPGPDAHALIDDLASSNPTVHAAADRALTQAAIAVATAERGGRLDPKAVDADWDFAPDADAGEFAAARAAGWLAVWADGLYRADPDYQALVAARRRYAGIVAKGGWPRVPEGKSATHPLAKDPRAAVLSVRLADEGYAVGDLAAALRDFQSRHGLAADGTLTAATVAALNTPAQARLSTIDANLERARWLPNPLPAMRVEADIAGEQVRLLEAGRSVLTMRAIVGAPSHHTPMLGSRITGVVFNPPWVVPRSIVTAELLPKERRHPGYLRRNGFALVNGQWVQAAGPKAALGYVKFDFPNPYSVYLHDTPARALFGRASRALSHGCVRVAAPRELAADLLASQKITLRDVNALIAARTTRRMAVATQTPVFLVYWTAATDGPGPVAFRPDIYGWDAKLTAALGKQQAASGAAL